MPSNEKKSKKPKITSLVKDNECPIKEGDNCLVPGVYSDSEPIGGA